MISRPVRRGALGAVAATLLLAGPAAAHPYFEPNEVPVDSLAQLTLDLAHGCGVEDHEDGHAHGDDAEEPTREVAIEVPDAASWIEPAESDGWDLEVERDDDGEAEVVVYTAQEGTDEPAPRFDLEVVLQGEVGDEVHWRVMQACDDVTYRWVGTEEEPAEDPAVTVTLVDADPAAPPPEPEEPEADQDEAADLDEADLDDLLDGEEVDEPADEPEDLDAQDLVTDAADDTAMPGWLLIVVLVATLGIAGLVLLLRGRDGDDADASDAT